jgi:hypothetical protein
MTLNAIFYINKQGHEKALIFIISVGKVKVKFSRYRPKSALGNPVC